jgi:hypothetical protein
MINDRIYSFSNKLSFYIIVLGITLFVFITSCNVKPLSVEDIDLEMEKRSLYLSDLIPVQIAFMSKIEEARASSKSAKEFLTHLKNIINEIQTTVPEIQQRNLIIPTVALYHITKEIDALTKEGLMPIDLSKPQFIRLRSGGESIWGSVWNGVCTGASYAWMGLVYVGEQVVTIAGYTYNASKYVLGGSIALVIGGCLLLQGDTGFCTDRYVDCIQKGGPNTVPNAGYTKCERCRIFCVSHAYWPYNSCPL